MKLLQSFIHSEFTQNILTSITGTAIAQFIPILVSPILSRIYSPQDYGIYGLFLSMSSLVSTVATGRYEMALILPKSDADVKSLINLMFRIISIVLVLMIVILIFFSDQIEKLFNPELSNYLFLFPVFVFSTSITQLVSYLLIRKKEFKVLASNKIISVIVSAGIQLILGVIFSSSIGLIVGGIIGPLAACFVVLKKGCLVRYSRFYRMPIKTVANEYREFPMYDMPAAILNTLSLQLPVMAFSKYFNMTVTGYYSFMNKILFMPTNLISRSVQDVFKQRAADDYNKYGNCHMIFLKTLRFLALAGIFPLLVLFIWGPSLFGFVFGHEWIIAGKYAQILVPLVYIRFIVSPLTNVFYITKKQKVDLYGQILYLVTSIISIGIGVYSNNIIILLSTYTILSSCVYLFYLSFSYIYSKGIK